MPETKNILKVEVVASQLIEETTDDGICSYMVAEAYLPAAAGKSISVYKNLKYFYLL